MQIIDKIKNWMPTESPFTKENAIIFSEIAMEVSLVAYMILKDTPVAIVSGTLIVINCLKTYAWKRRITYRRDTEFNYYAKIQAMELVIAGLRKEVDELKAQRNSPQI